MRKRKRMGEDGRERAKGRSPQGGDYAISIYLSIAKEWL